MMKDRKTSKATSSEKMTENQEEKAARVQRYALAEAVKQKEHRADALALGAEEGRDKLRKAAVSRKQAVTRRYPNGETHMEKLHVP